MVYYPARLWRSGSDARQALIARGLPPARVAALPDGAVIPVDAVHAFVIQEAAIWIICMNVCYDSSEQAEERIEDVGDWCIFEFSDIERRRFGEIRALHAFVARAGLAVSEVHGARAAAGADVTALDDDSARADLLRVERMLRLLWAERDLGNEALRWTDMFGALEGIERLNTFVSHRPQPVQTARETQLFLRQGNAWLIGPERNARRLASPRSPSGMLLTWHALDGDPIPGSRFFAPNPRSIRKTLRGTVAGDLEAQGCAALAGVMRDIEVSADLALRLPPLPFRIITRG